MKRTLSKLLALVLIVTVIGAMAAVPAMASAPAEFTYTPPQADYSVSFTKNLVINSGSGYPAVTFNFTVTPDGDTSALATPSVIFAGNSTATGTVTQTGTFSLPASRFTRPGIYYFEIAETAGNEPGFTYDNRTLTLAVSVIDANGDGNLSIQGVSLSDGDGDKTGTFTNRYVGQHNFGFTKTVNGTQGDKTKLFRFTLDITNAFDGDYTVVVDGASDTITVSDGSYNGTFYLKHGSSVQVLGLNYGATCAVSEDAGSYEATYQVNDGSAVTASSYSGSLTDDTTVAFTNTLNGTVPTGILLTVAPFAVGLLLFGSLVIFLAAKKRRAEDED